MSTPSWSIVSTKSRGPVAVLELHHESQGMNASMRIDRILDDEEPRDIVTVSFTSGRGDRLHIVAEAARLFAQVCDTLADLACDGEPMECDDPTLSIATVELRGRDAAWAIAPYFGDDVCNALCGIALAPITAAVAATKES